MDFGVLGPLEVGPGGRHMSIGGRTQRRLLTALLIHAGGVLSSDRLIAILWGDEPPEGALPTLYTYVSRLRGLLHANGDEMLVTRPPGYLLQVRPEQTDAGRFERLLNEARGVAADEPQIALTRLNEALDLWRGSAYAEFSDAEFAWSEARRLEELRLAAIEERFDAELALGRHAGLVGALEAFTTEHPLRERPRVQLMLALYRSGRHAEALSVFRTFRQQLDEELGVEPSATLRALETTILRQDAELDWTPPPASAAQHTGDTTRPTPGTPGSLPGEASSLIGREQDVAAVAAALSEYRLVTLTGVGGVGKTRLAMQAAARAASRYPDGVWYCELAPITDGAAVGHALAATLGARQQPGWSIEQSVLAFLATRQLLLVVDNCEHVLDNTAPVLEGIVRACPQVSLLATSRTALGVTGERIQPTAPLPVPESASGSEAAESPAVQLFVDRGRAVRPSLDLNDENLAHIADVCRQLDGLPLAIELAAVRIRSLNPVDLAARLGDRFGLLTTAKQTTPARHRTLRAVVDWSYTQLSPAEQHLFDRLSVFADGFTLAAAEAVSHEAALVDLLAALVDNSLVVAGPTAGQVRYSMLDTLRAYGREMLERRGELDALRNAHAEYYVTLAEAAERGLRGPDEGRWIAILDADLGNMRAAHLWAVEQSATDLAMRLSAGLYHYALYQFHDEVVSWGETALDLPGAETNPLYPAVCGAVGEGLTLRADLQRARALAEHASARVSDSGDRRRIPVLKVMAAVALYEGRLDDCIAWAGEQLRLARSHDAPWYVAEALLYQGLAQTYAGDPAGGLVIADENLQVAKNIGNSSMTAWAMYSQAEALSLSDPDQARQRYEGAVALAESVSSTFTSNIAQVGLAALFTRSGEPADALRAFRHSVSRWHRMNVWHHQWTTLRNLLQLLIRIHAHEAAATLLGALGAADTAAYGTDADNMVGSANLLRNALGEPAFAAATARGATMTADAMVEFALSTIDRALK